MMQEDIERVRAVKKEYETELLRKANVVGVGIALDDERSDELQPVLVVNVAWDELAPTDRIPKELDGVPVEVEAIGHVRAHHRDD
jgi:hypothetical protein